MATMSEQETGKPIRSACQAAVELRLAVRAGDVATIRALLRADPALASARFFGDGSRPRPTENAERSPGGGVGSGQWRS
jgi:hypothetical protein